MTKRRMKYDERMNKKIRRMKKASREIRIRAAMRMTKRQLAEELVLLHELINELDDQVVANRHLVRELLQAMDVQVKTNRHLVHELDQCKLQIERQERDTADLFQRIQDLEETVQRNGAEEQLFDDADV